jgi:uncharacterized integral membrane protein
MDKAPEPPAAPPETAPVPEPRRARLRRQGRHARLYSWAVLAIAVLVVLIALIAANTRQVKISWVVGSTHTSLVWIIVTAAVLGWLTGVATSVIFRRRTRRSS